MHYHFYLLIMCNKGRFCKNSIIDTLISKQLSEEKKAKLSQLEIVNKRYCGGGVLSCQSYAFESGNSRSKHSSNLFHKQDRYSYLFDIAPTDSTGTDFVRLAIG